jgi:23S rRNA (cytosine1962-C5)-methyltransferase
MDETKLEQLLDKAFAERQSLIDADHHSALHLFAGFYEGNPDLVIDLYGRTLLLFDFSENPASSSTLLEEAQRIALSCFPWLECVIQKARNSADPNLKRGRLTFGDKAETSILENGIRYALDMTMSQDAGFFLDTRGLRQWITAHTQDLTVLNTFAYTGSLGVAALAGGAARVVQLDRNSRYMELARRSAMINHLDLGRMKLQASDFFAGVGGFKRAGTLFDLVILDPPFFSVSERGRVDQAAEGDRLINKVRPLIRDGGKLIVINNALFLSGAAFMGSLQDLCADGYLTVEEMVPVPADITGYPTTKKSSSPVDPAPFNHSTKIVILNVKRKASEK